MRIDLHSHSTASDGDYSPAEVVALALRHRLDVLALTDHDTTAGLEAARAAAAGTALQVLPGVEMATVQADGRTIDLLGYCFDPADAAFQEQLATMRATRIERAAAMVDRLAGLGLPIRLERVFEIAGKGAVGRPHVAQALLEAGHVATRQQAFDRYIGNEGPAYVPHYEISIERAIALLHRAGGVAVLAHPIRVRALAVFDADDQTWAREGHPTRVQALAAAIAPWVAAGLDGLEVYYPDHGPLFTRDMRVLAREHGLIMTGGSDFHRMEDGAIRLGTQDVPDECVPQLLAKAATYR